MINWFDVILLAMVFFAAVAGFKRGFVRQFFDLAGVLAAYYIALRYSGVLVNWLGLFIPIDRWLAEWFAIPLPGGLLLGDVLLRLIAFVLLFFLVRMVVMALSGMLHWIFTFPLLSTVNRLGGFILGLLKGVLLAIILIAVMKLLGTPFWLKTLEESVVASMVFDLVPLAYRQMFDFLLKDLPGAV